MNGVSFTMVKVKGSTFQRNCPIDKDEDIPDAKRLEQRITLSDFYIGKFEVTQELWEAVMGDNPSYYDYDPERMKAKFGGTGHVSRFTPQHPVDMVS